MPASLIALRLLGGFEVSAGGATIIDQTWARKRPMALVKLLAVQPDHRMSRDAVLAELWPDLSQASAATQLRKSRLHVRQAMSNAGCDVDLLQASDGVVRLSPDVSVDAESFERAAREALADPDNVVALVRAVEAYRGDLLPDDQGEEWADRARMRIRTLYHETLLALSRQLEALGDVRRAIEVTGQLTESDPLNEDAHRTLMRLFVLEGRRDLALRQFETLRAILQTELDAVPDDETERLLSRIKRGQVGAGRRIVADTPLVGRADEVRKLREAFERARAGTGQFVVLRGEAGIGKTRLAEWLARHAQQSGARVHWVRSYANESERGFEAWIRVIAELANGDGRRRPGRATAAAPSEPSSRIHSLIASRSTEPDALFGQVGDLLRHSARSEALVLVFDDLQWCGPDSLRLLEAVARTVSGTSIMILGTVRVEAGDTPPAAAPVIEELLNHRGCRVLELTGLQIEDVERLIALNDDAPAGLDARDLWAKTRGNPLFVTEMLLTMRSDPRAGSMATVPARVTAVIRRRIARLSDDARRLLEFASAFGDEFNVSLLSRATDVPAARVLALVEEARHEAIVAAGRSSDGFTFEHPLMCDVLYNDIAMAQRAVMHLRIARALEAHYGAAVRSHAAELAYHYERGLSAGGEDEAMRFLFDAGLQALAELAFEDASRHLDSALAIALDRRPTDRAYHGELRLQLGNALYRSYDGTQRERSVQVLAAALDDARAAGASQLFVRVVSAIAGKRKSGLGVNAEKIALLREALDLVPEDDDLARCDLSGRLAKELEGEADDRVRLEAGRLAIALARSIDHCETSGVAMLYGIDAISGPDTLEERLSVTRDLVALRLPRGESVTTQGHLRRYAALLEAADIDRAERELAKLVQAGNEHPVATTRRWAERWSTLLAADRAAGAGRFADAEVLAQRGLALGQALEDPDAVSILGSQLFQIRWHQGRASELSGLAAGVVASAPGFWPWTVASALIQFSAGEAKSAKAAFARLAAGSFVQVTRDRFWMVTLTVAAELCARLEDRGGAAQLLSLIKPFTDRVAVLGYGQVSGGSMARTAGQLYAVIGEWDLAEQYFEEAHRVNTAMGALAWVAWTELAYARMLGRRGRKSDASRTRTLLESAMTTARECGMASLQAEVDLLLSST